MATLLLLHSALGLRPGVHTFADRLRAAGHEVHTPDLLDGRTFPGGASGYEAAMAFCDTIETQVGERTDAAYAALCGPVVVGGLSMGTGQAQRLAVEHEGVVGALLIAGGGLYPQYLDAYPWAGSWRGGVPIALHRMVDDPWCEPEPLALLVQTATRAGSDVSDYVYPGAGHLFMDEGLPQEHDRAAAGLLDVRALGFLSRFTG